ncbi:MAG: FIST N-terminal domain-containing protein [Planctomycetota bacterium]
MADGTEIVCGSGLVSAGDPVSAADELSDRLGVSSPDLVMVFASAEHAGRMGMVEDRVRQRTGARHIVALTAGGVMGGGSDGHGGGAMAGMAMRLPGVRLRPFWIEPGATSRSPGERAAELGEQIGAGDDLRGAFVFADPFSVPLVNLIPDLAACRTRRVTPGGREEPIGVIAGGLASAANQPGRNTLVCDGRIRTSGAMGVALSGEVRIDAVVSQGCRPFGPRMVITKARGNLILELGGERAVEAVRVSVRTLDDDDRRLLGGALLMGRAIDETKQHLGRGDYLVRGVLGADEESGSIAVGDLVRAGQTVRLHLRDARTAREDLSLLMDGQRLHGQPAGALMFSCVDRGEAFFGSPGHDAGAVSRAFDPMPDGPQAAKTGEAVGPGSGIPLAGFFAAGEIGPIGDEIYHHEQTAVAVMIRNPDESID